MSDEVHPIYHWNFYHDAALAELADCCGKVALHLSRKPRLGDPIDLSLYVGETPPAVGQPVTCESCAGLIGSPQNVTADKPDLPEPEARCEHGILEDAECPWCAEHQDELDAQAEDDDLSLLVDELNEGDE